MPLFFLLLLLAYLSELVSNNLPSKTGILVQIFTQYSVGLLIITKLKFFSPLSVGVEMI